MIELDKTKIYNLLELNNEELQQVLDFLCTEDEQWLKITFKNFSEGLKNVRLTYGDHGWMWVGHGPTANAKELFYTLDSIQVDCRNLTEGQVKEMCKVYENNGYKQWIDPEAFIIIDNFTYLRIDSENEFYITGGLDTKTTITYEKFMELFGEKEDVCDSPQPLEGSVSFTAVEGLKGNFEIDITPQAIIKHLTEKDIFLTPKQYKKLWKGL